MHSPEPGHSFSSLAGPRRTGMWLALFLGVLTAYRIYLAQSIPLSGDEAYYWEWSRRLAWGYYDQGPLIAGAIRVGTFFFGDTPLGIRFMSVICGLGLSLVIYDFCARLAEDRLLGLGLVIAANATLLFGAGSVLATYDLPMALFWLLSLECMALALFRAQPWAWIPAGAALGLSLLGKYVAAPLPLMVLGFLLARPSRRYWLKRKEPWLGLAAALLVFSPNLVWNVAHGFVSFRHTLGHAGGAVNFTTFEFLASQVGIVTPIIFVLLAWGMVLAWGQARRGDDLKAFLLWTSLPLWGLFFLLSFKSRIYANWPAPAYLAAMLAGGLALRERLSASAKVRGWALAGAALGYALLVALQFHGPLLGTLGVPPRLDPFASFHAWDEVGKDLTKILTRWQGPRPFVFTYRYQNASLASYYLPGKPLAVVLFYDHPPQRLNQYVFWNDLAQLKGRDALAFMEGDRHPGEFFVRARKIGEIYYRGPSGNFVRRISYYRCSSFKGYDRRPGKFLSPRGGPSHGP